MIKPPPAGPIVAGVAFTTVWIMAFDKTPIDSLKSQLEGAAAGRRGAARFTPQCCKWLLVLDG